MGKFNLVELLVSILIVAIASIVVLSGVASIVERAVSIKTKIELQYLKYDNMVTLN